MRPSTFGGTCPQRTQQCPKGSDPRLQTSTQENSASRFLKCSTECSAHFAQPTQDQERWRLAVEHRAAIHLVFDDSLADPRVGVLWKDPRIFLSTKAHDGAPVRLLASRMTMTFTRRFSPAQPYLWHWLVRRMDRNARREFTGRAEPMWIYFF